MTVADYISKDELVVLMRRSDARGWSAFAVNWALIIGAFALAIAWPNPLSIAGAVLIIAGRQLGLGILVHDCAHHALFRDRRTNEVAGKWLAGIPINLSLTAYRAYHLAHHRHAGTPEDPDLGFVAAYPISRVALRRKLLRDLTGRTGARDLIRSLSNFQFARQWPWLAFHLALLALLSSVGAGWSYTLWWVAWIFVYPVIVRLRQVGEHGVVIDRGDMDPRLNTSTTLPVWWERLLIAPNHVGYHVEHHLAAGVPPYRLRSMHKLLRARGFYEGFDAISLGYADVVRRATRQRA